MLFFYDLYGNKHSSSEEQLHIILQSSIYTKNLITLVFKCPFCQWCISLNGTSLIGALCYSSVHFKMLSLFSEKGPQTELFSTIHKCNRAGHLIDQIKTFNMADILNTVRGEATRYYTFVVVVHVSIPFIVGDNASKYCRESVSFYTL